MLLPMLLLIGALAGCGGGSTRWHGEDVVVLVTGASGNGPWYAGVKSALKSEEGQAERQVYTYRWGAPLPLLVFNFQDRGIHARAEKELAQGLAHWRTAHPDGRIQLMAHSAGSGVVLGALSRLDAIGPAVKVERVVLLAPSVSSGYDLRPALNHVIGQMHVFHSDRDTVHLKWRAHTFGTYDNIRTTAAGNVGFATAQVPDDLKSRLVQHPYDPGWSELGHDGGHWGSVEQRFVSQVLRPLLH